MSRIAVALGVVRTGVGPLVPVGVAGDTVGGSHRGLILAVRTGITGVRRAGDGPREAGLTLTLCHGGCTQGGRAATGTRCTRFSVQIRAPRTPTVLHTLAQRGGREAGGAGEAGSGLAIHFKFRYTMSRMRP